MNTKLMYLDGSALLCSSALFHAKGFDFKLSLRKAIQSGEYLPATSSLALSQAERFLWANNFSSDLIQDWLEKTLDLCELLSLRRPEIQRTLILVQRHDIPLSLASHAAIVLEQGLVGLMSAQPEWYNSLPLLSLYPIS